MNSQEATEKLGHKGIKATANRIIIYQALEAARHPMSLADLEEKLLTMDKSSIFRVLNLFVKHDVVHAFEDGRGIQHYELCGHEDECLHTDTHPHFYCEQCHRSFCLDDTTLPHISLPDGYIPRFYSFIIKGLCADCSRKLGYVLFFLMLTIFSWAQNPYVFPEAIKPLVKTQWGQHFPYNILCPQTEKNGQTVYAVAGCGSLAMAQIINYHQYPEKSPDGAYLYDWDLMFKTYQQGISNERLVCVAKLISDCGASSFTDYSEITSNTNLSAIMGAMKRLFRYTNNMCLYKRDDFSTPARDSLYKELLFNELKAGRPVIYRGYNDNKKEGHLFLIDGCKGDKVHVNMGWGGNRNDYYELDDLSGYQKGQWMLIEVADTTYQPTYTNIQLATPGTLGQVLTPAQQLRTRHIRLEGSMNNDDFTILRQMLQEGVLRTIDMAQVDMNMLPDSAFYECSYLSHFIAPKNLRHTGNVTFYQCRNLNRAVFYEGLEYVGGKAFCGCTNLLEVRLPSTVKRIFGNAFNSCNALLNVVLPENLERIGNYVFAHCKHLNSLYLPKSLVYIGQDLTTDCPRLKRITLDCNNTYYTIENGAIKKITE